MALKAPLNFASGEHRDSPGYDAEAITNGVDYIPAVTCRCLYVGGTGDVVFLTAGQAEAGSTTTVKLTAIPGGTFVPLQFTKIVASGTTATGLVAIS